MSSIPRFVETSHALAMVSATVVFRGGSADDPRGKEGVARLTAGMLRRGTATLTPTDVEQQLDALGCEFECSVGPTTISVKFDALTRHLDRVIALIALLIQEPAFEGAELEKLKDETRADLLERQDDDRGLSGRALLQTLYAGHPFGRPSAGTLASLSAIGPDDLRAFHAKTFCRSKAAVSVAGDVDDSRANLMVERLVEHLPEGQGSSATIAEPAPPTGRHLVIVEKPERTQTQLMVGSLGTSAHDADHVDLWVANTAFGGTFTSRLMTEIRVNRGWSYGANSSLSLEATRGHFVMSTAPAIEDAVDCLNVQLDLLSTLRRDGIDEEETSFVQHYLTRSHPFDIDTARKRVAQRLAELVCDLPVGYYDAFIPRVAAVTSASAGMAARARLSDRNFIISVVGESASLRGPLERSIPDLSSVTIVPSDFEWIGSGN